MGSEEKGEKNEELYRGVRNPLSVPNERSTCISICIAVSIILLFEPIYLAASTSLFRFIRSSLDRNQKIGNVFNIESACVPISILTYAPIWGRHVCSELELFAIPPLELFLGAIRESRMLFLDICFLRIKIFNAFHLNRYTTNNSDNINQDQSEL
ncbi:hypothetical protein GQX74_015668 [Glossina fuscipes]|nr:hypothetical protein GQX74_015668 [Glossina fuscipes]